MKSNLYFWLTQLAYKMCKYHGKKVTKWSDRHTKWLNKWEKYYITGGGVQ